MPVYPTVVPGPKDLARSAVEPAILSRGLQRFLGRISILGTESHRVPSDQHPRAWSQCRSALVRVATARDTGALVRGSTLCGAPRASGVGGLDSGTKERTGRVLLLRCHLCLHPLRTAGGGDCR